MKPPIILTPGKLKEINEYVLAKTGCFVFLISEENWLYSEPQTGKGAVELWSVALYAIYHDYGCRYLRFVLDKENLPNALLDQQAYNARKHKSNIECILRMNVAHGVLDTNSSKKLLEVFFSQKDGPISQISDEKWCEVAERIKKESDDLVKYIYKWADEYSKKRCYIRTKFGNSYDFLLSIDSRVITALENDFSKFDTEKIKKRSDNEKKLWEWRELISDLFINETIKSPEEVITQLKEYLFDSCSPKQQSSITIGELCGFSLQSLIE